MADTSVWIEYLKGREPIHSIFRDFLEMGRIYSVPWIFGELLQGASDKDLDRILDFWRAIEKPPTTELADIWIGAGYYSKKNGWISKGVGLIDAAILQAARTRGFSVWTLDKKFGSIIPSGSKFSVV